MLLLAKYLIIGVVFHHIFILGKTELSWTFIACTYPKFYSPLYLPRDYVLLTCRQICNAGFLIPASQRGQGFGSVLARSYLHYGPRLGYEASVFNLVYVNNIASVK